MFSVHSNYTPNAVQKLRSAGCSWPVEVSPDSPGAELTSASNLHARLCQGAEQILRLQALNYSTLPHNAVLCLQSSQHAPGEYALWGLFQGGHVLCSIDATLEACQGGQALECAGLRVGDVRQDVTIQSHFAFGQGNVERLVGDAMFQRGCTYAAHPQLIQLIALGPPSCLRMGQGFLYTANGQPVAVAPPAVEVRRELKYALPLPELASAALHLNTEV